MKRKICSLLILLLLCEVALCACGSGELSDYRTDPPRQSQSVRESEMVWIPFSGKRYHNHPSCSNMKNPTKVTVEQAKKQGYTPCQKCY